MKKHTPFAFDTKTSAQSPDKSNEKKKVGGKRHQVRIIGGQYKRVQITVPDVEGLRPTPDRVRETVFNWLEHFIQGAWGQMKVIDAFAGTGALGFEALSRGAQQLVLCETSRNAWQNLKSVQEKLQTQSITLCSQDALTYLRQQAAKSCHLIFLDPPFHQHFVEKCLPLCQEILIEGGLLYVEAEFSLRTLPDLNEQHWELLRADKAGMVHYHLLIKK